MEASGPNAGEAPPEATVDRLRAALVGRYRVERELGRGGMAVVFLAQDLKHSRQVAIKVIRPEVSSVVGTERFHREVRLAARLQHPNIVAVYDSGNAGGTLYYVMPYIGGESLRARIQREGQVPLADALEIARDVAAALEYAHGNGVVHRDIKPENILLSGGRALVLDFGIARALSGDGLDGATVERLTETGLSLGTPAYMSPEQASGRGPLDRRTDVYSLGCVLYEMLTGETPFTGPNARAIIAKLFVEPVPRVRTLRDAVPPALEQVVTRALAKSAADRFPTAAAFAEALAAQALAPSSAAPIISATIPVAGPRRQSRWLAAAAGAVLVTAGIAAALALRTSPAASRVPAADRRVLVSTFVNKTGDAANDPVGRMAADWISHGLVQTGLVDVVQPPPGADAGAANPAERGAAMVISGAYYGNGDSLDFQAQVADADSGRILRAVGPVRVAATKPVEGIDQLRERLMGALAVLLDARFREWARLAPTVPTYDAYRQFVDGVDAYRRADWEAAMTHLQQATVIDPSFTLARLWLAEAHMMAAGNFAAAIDSLLALPPALRDALPPLDRAVLDFRVALRRGDRAGAFEAARRAATLWPDRYALNAAGLSLGQSRPREALQWLGRVNAEHGFVSGWDTYWSILGTARHWLGEYRQELADARRARRRLPNEVGMVVMEAQALIAVGQVAQALRMVDSAVGFETAYGDVQGGLDAAYVAASELAAHGYPGEARAIAASAVDRAVARLGRERRDSADPAAETDLRSVWLDVAYRAEQWDQAGAMADSILALEPGNFRALWRLASLAARRGDRAEAERFVGIIAAPQGTRALRGWRPIDPLAESWLAGGAVAAILGDRDEAVRLVARALAQDRFHPFELHHEKDFEPLRDFPPFQAILHPKE